MTFWRRWFLLANVLSWGLIFGTTRALAQSPSAPAYVFVIDTSAPMAVHKVAIAKAVAAQIKDGLQGKMRAGEAFAIWGCNDELSVVQHFRAAWDPRLAQSIATRVTNGLETQPFQGKPSLARAMAEASKLILATDSITFVIVNNGASPVTGTPFDAKIQAACRPAEFDALFTTTLVARGGQVIGWSVECVEASGAKLSVELSASGKTPAPVWTRESGAASMRIAARPKTPTQAPVSSRPEDKRVIEPRLTVDARVETPIQPVPGSAGTQVPEATVLNAAVNPVGTVQASPQSSPPSAQENLAENGQAGSAKTIRGELSISSAQAAPAVAIAAASGPAASSESAAIPPVAVKAENSTSVPSHPEEAQVRVDPSLARAVLPSAVPSDAAVSESDVQNAAQATALPAASLTVPTAAVVPTKITATKPPAPIGVEPPSGKVAPERLLRDARAPIDGPLSGPSLAAVSSGSSVFLLAGLALLGVAVGLWFWMRPRAVINHPSLISQSLDSAE